MNDSFIITPDRILGLAQNYISRYSVKINLTSENNVFFIKTDYIKEFAQIILPKINYKFILLTHDSDFPIPGSAPEILDNPNLIMWLGMNVHQIHPKLKAIPIGMANEVWPHGDKKIVTKIIEENNPKTNLVYCNFDPNTNPEQRYPTIEKLKHLPFVDMDFDKQNYESYLRKVSKYKYIISPPGNSIDCHRVWESIYVNTIPICLKSIPMHYFKEGPILFVDEWNDLNEELLNQSYEKIKSKPAGIGHLGFYINYINQLLDPH